jgi:hypothetical protein
MLVLEQQLPLLEFLPLINYTKCIRIKRNNPSLK